MKQNYKIIKTGVTGTSRGFSLLGLISLKSPTYAEAIKKLYHLADISEGKAQALVTSAPASRAPAAAMLTSFLLYEFFLALPANARIFGFAFMSAFSQGSNKLA